jgi:hypothetical protein
MKAQMVNSIIAMLGVTGLEAKSVRLYWSLQPASAVREQVENLSAEIARYATS